MIDLKPGVSPKSAAITWLPMGETWLVGDSAKVRGNPDFCGGAFCAASQAGVTRRARIEPSQAARRQEGRPPGRGRSEDGWNLDISTLKYSMEETPEPGRRAYSQLRVRT